MRPWFAEVEARAESEAPAIITSTERWSYRDLFGRAGGAQRWLQSLEVPVGRPIMALLESVPESFALAVAAPATGRPMAPLSPRLTATELAAVATTLRPSVIISHAENSALAGEVADRAGVPVAVIDGLEPAPWTPALEVGDDVPFMVLHTSGTTGVPKAVPKYERHMAVGSGGFLNIGEDSVYATASPFNHIAGIGMLMVTLGCGAAFAPIPRFTVAGWSEVLDLGITHATLVPTMWEMLISAGEMRPGSLRVLQHGAAPMPPDLLRRAIDLLPGVDLFSVYGQTEGAPITCLTPDDHRLGAAGRPELLETVGRPVDGVELRIDSAEPGGVGEVVARAPHLFHGDADGWLHTGDLGSLTPDGYLKLAGRKGDMIIRGGENVYPIEVENVLEAHPAIREVAVVGQPDARYGEIVAAYVVLAGLGTSPSPAELHDFARKSLAGFKVPTSWTFLDALPRSAAGKVLKRELLAAKDG